jgi:hypothetical protein
VSRTASPDAFAKIASLRGRIEEKKDAASERWGVRRVLESLADYRRCYGQATFSPIPKELESLLEEDDAVSQASTARVGDAPDVEMAEDAAGGETAADLPASHQ